MRAYDGVRGAGRLPYFPRAKLSMANIRRFRNNISIVKIGK